MAAPAPPSLSTRSFASDNQASAPVGPLLTTVSAAGCAVALAGKTSEITPDIPSETRHSRTAQALVRIDASTPPWRQ
jgi:hypothetical protein